MPDIVTTDYKGLDRRNGGRLKLSFMEWVRLIGIAGTVIVFIVTFYLTTRNNISLLADDSKENKITDRRQGEAILVMQGALNELTADIECIKSSSEEQTKALYKILGKLEERDRREP